MDNNNNINTINNNPLSIKLNNSLSISVNELNSNLNLNSNSNSNLSSNLHLNSNLSSNLSPITSSYNNYSPSPTSINTDHSPSTNNTPNPIITATATSVKVENASILPLHSSSFQPLLTSINDINDISHYNNLSNKENIHNLNVRNIPMPLFTTNTKDWNNNLPPLPNINININKNKKRKYNKRNMRNNNNKNKLKSPIKIEKILKSKSKSKSRSQSQSASNSNSKLRPRSRSKSKSKSKSKSISSASSSNEVNSNETYSVITSAFDHNLRVKQSHLHSIPIRDTSFDECYIFSMRCPYTDCCSLFDNMTSYQNHHIINHQLRDINGKLIQSKEAKWKCPDCNKISASWYNYAAHVTMHKDSCDAPWICKLNPLNKKKFIKWTDGKLICGKRCSTKHNLIKHLKALHTNHRIIDLTQSVKASSQQIKYGDEMNYNNSRSRSRSQSQSQSQSQKRKKRKKKKKRPNFSINPINNSNSTSLEPLSSFNMSYEPPRKKIKIDPDANGVLVLPIFNTGEESNNWGAAPNKSVKSQSNFVGLLLEAAELLENDNDNDNKSKAINSSDSNSNISSYISLENLKDLISSIKTIFNSSSCNLSAPSKLDYNMTQLSAMFAIGIGAYSSFDLLNIKLKTENNINISNLTDISSVPIPSIQSISCKQMSPDIPLIPNIPTAPHTLLSPINDLNPIISLPKLPLPPPPPKQPQQQQPVSVDSLIKLFQTNNNNNNNNITPINNRSPHLLFNKQTPIKNINIPPLPIISLKQENNNNNNIISSNILSALPKIVISDDK